MTNFPPQGSGISGSLQLIQSIAPLTAVATSVTFSNLDINTDRKYILEIFVNNRVLNSDYYIFVNNDQVVANYFKTSLSADFGVSAVSSVNSPQFIFMSQVGDRFYGQLNIILGDDTLMRCHNQLMRDVFIPNSGVWNSSVIHNVATANITRLDVVSNNANAIGIGSFFRLYRVHP